MAANFDKYLKVKVADIPENYAYLPVGHFHGTISKWAVAERDYDKANGGPKTPVVEILTRVTAASDDVDAETLPKGYVGMQSGTDYRLNDPNMAGHTSIRRLAKSLGVKLADSDDLDMVLDAIVGSDVLIYNEPRADKNNEGVYYNNFKRILAPQ